jgi:hypothetical protein
MPAVAQALCQFHSFHPKIDKKPLVDIAKTHFAALQKISCNAAERYLYRSRAAVSAAHSWTFPP